MDGDRPDDEPDRARRTVEIAPQLAAALEMLAESTQRLRELCRELQAEPAHQGAGL